MAIDCTSAMMLTGILCAVLGGISGSTVLDRFVLYAHILISGYFRFLKATLYIPTLE